ncbi:UNVERIFIED_ORG: hypothetical protein BDU10_2546 [Burkholderia sp. CF145]
MPSETLEAISRIFERLAPDRINIRLLYALRKDELYRLLPVDDVAS